MGRNSILTMAMTTALLAGSPVPAGVDLAELVKRIQPCVTTIITHDKDEEVLGQGTGFFINKKGHLLTNYHVFKGAHSAAVKTFDQKTYPIKSVVAASEDADLIKVSVDIPEKAVTFLQIARNSIGMKLVGIPASEFDMGSPSSERNRSSDEGPIHWVKISKGFWIGQTEVTQAQEAGNGEVLSEALTRLSYAVSEANASRGGATASVADAVVQNANDAGRPTPPANAGRTATEKTVNLGHGVSMVFVLIPAGSFYMGSPDSEKDRDDDEGPMRRVQITKAFYMGKYEVTQDQYVAVIEKDPSKFSGQNLPVEGVSWGKAVAFCSKVGGRLPTEAEWEYACRAGSKTRFCYGDDPYYEQLGDYAWSSFNSDGKSHAIGQKKPNSFGLYDMYGNVYEWCSDWFAAYANEQTVNPVGPPSGLSRICRGGCWDYEAKYCRSANRNCRTPDDRLTSLIGFRVVLDLN